MKGDAVCMVLTLGLQGDGMHLFDDSHHTKPLTAGVDQLSEGFASVPELRSRHIHRADSLPTNQGFIDCGNSST
jgi:hypothetical protein